MWLACIEPDEPGYDKRTFGARDPKRYGEDREVSGNRISPNQLDACYLNPGKEPCQPGFAGQVRSSRVVDGPEGAFAAGKSFGSLKYKHHFRLDCFSMRREHWTLQASLTHSSNDNFFAASG